MPVKCPAVGLVYGSAQVRSRRRRRVGPCARGVCSEQEATVRLAAICLFVGLWTACFTAGGAEDWPKWLGPRGDGISRETGLLEKWPEEGPKKLWQAKVGIGFSSPVAVEGRVYLMHTTPDKKRDVLTCFDADTGKVIWEESYEGAYSGEYPGTRATPTIADGRIYTYGGNGQLVCRELATGKAVWFIGILKETGARNLPWGLASSPLLYKDRIYVQNGNGGPMVVAVDRNTGKIVLQSESGMGSYATLVIADVGPQKQLIAFTGKAIRGMDPDTLKTIWSHEWVTSWDVNACTPLYRDGHVLLSSDYNHGSIMLKLNPGAAPTKLWEDKKMRAHFQPLILDGGVFYGNDQGTLKCIAWPGGEQKWEARERNLRLMNGGSLVRVGDKLIAMSERGMLSLLKATPEGCTLISQVQLFQGNPIWSTPLIYRGRLYAKGVEEFVCLDISGK